MPLRSGRLSQRDGVHRAGGCAVVSDATISFVVLAAVVVVFVWDRLPVAIVAIGVALSLWATGVLDLGQALDGFGDPAVLFIAALFVVSEALDATGVTAWAGQELIARVGREPDAADRADDAARRRSDGADQRQRRRGSAGAGGRRDGRAARPLAVAAADADRLRRPRGLAARPDGHAGQRDRVRVRRRGGGGDDSATSSSRSSACRCSWARSRSSSCSASGCCPQRSARVLPRDFSDHARTLVEQYELDADADELLHRKQGVAEVVIPPRSRRSARPCSRAW